MALHTDNKTKHNDLYISFELSLLKWVLDFSNGKKRYQRTIEALDLEALDKAIETAKLKLAISDDATIHSCYEAGRDGFYLHRHLLNIGINNYVIDAASMEVSRRGRQVKTDKIDAIKLNKLLQRYVAGDSSVWSVVVVPSKEQEDLRNLHRSEQRLQKELTRIRNQLKSIFVCIGSRLGYVPVSKEGWEKKLKATRTLTGDKILPYTLLEIENLYKIYIDLRKLLMEIEKEKKLLLETSEEPSIKMVKQLMELKGVGLKSAWLFVMEFFGWRKFKNRRQVGGLSGLVSCPYDSGNSRISQGISKAGNRRVRGMITEIAWKWLDYQPDCKISIWFKDRFGPHSKRSRRVGIVAVCRRLLIGLWRYLETGELGEGMVLKELSV